MFVVVERWYWWVLLGRWIELFVWLLWVGFGMLLEQKNGEWAVWWVDSKHSKQLFLESWRQGAAGYQSVGTFVG